MKTIINFRLTPQQIKELDKLVKTGIYKTKTDAIRKAIDNLVKNY